jgi:hypothetical protein
LSPLLARPSHTIQNPTPIRTCTQLHVYWPLLSLSSHPITSTKSTVKSLMCTRSTVTVTNTVPASHLESKTHHTVVNPRRSTGLRDTRSIVVELPPTKRTYSDEQTLAAYIQGYFGGWVFAPERRALQILHRRLVNFTGKPPLNHDMQSRV